MAEDDDLSQAGPHGDGERAGLPAVDDPVEVRWAAVTLLVVVGAAATVWSWRVVDDRGAAGWWALGLVVLGLAVGSAAGALPTRELRGGVVSVGLLVVAAVVAGRGLLTPDVAESAADRLAGRGLPAVDRYTAALLVAATALASVVATAARDVTGRRDGARQALRPHATARVVAATAGAVAAGAAIVVAAGWAGARWDERTTAGVASEHLDHRHGGSSQMSRMDSAGRHVEGIDGVRGPVDGWRRLWRQDAHPDVERAFVVTGTDVVLTYRVGGPDAGESGLVALDAATGDERWRYLLAEPADLGGLAASPGAGRVVLLVGDVAVQLDLYTGAEVRRDVLPTDPVDDTSPPAPETGLAVLGAPGPGLVPEADAIVEAFTDTLLVQQRLLAPSGYAGAAKVMALDLDGTVREVERPPATDCRYSALYRPDSDAPILVRDGDCGPIQVSLYKGSTRTSVYDLDLGAAPCRASCRAIPHPGRTHADTALLRFSGSTQVRTMRDSLAAPFELPDDLWSSTTSIVPVVDRTTGTGTPRIVLERSGQDGYVLDLDGAVASRFAPLPGTAHGSVATPDGWYRFHRTSDATGRVEVLDPATLEPGEPSPEMPCRDARGMSTSRGRLLVLCDTAELVMFGD